MLFRVSQNDALMARVFGFPKVYSLVFSGFPACPSFMPIFQMRGLLLFSGVLSDCLVRKSRKLLKKSESFSWFWYHAIATGMVSAAPRSRPVQKS